jgi:short-subunit dehydrogenase
VAGKALITGASSGIGEEFSRQLARRGYGLVLTARRAERLSRLASELGEKHGIQVETLRADLSDPAGVSAVEARAAAGDITLLVNNAGFGIGKKFARSGLGRQEAMLSVHVTAPMRLMHATLPAMMNQHAGGVINVASLAAFFSIPGDANYSATKAYLARFSRAVHGEVRASGVTVQALCPGLTVTEMHFNRQTGKFEGRGPKFIWSSAAVVVQSSLRAFDRGRSLCVPGGINKVIYWLGKWGVADAVLPFVIR